MASVPLYLRIRDRIRAEFLLDGPQEGARRLPTERALQERYGVSRPTIAKAIAALAAEGDLVSAQGRGRFVVARNDGAESGAPIKRLGYVASIATETLTQRVCFGIERAARRRGYRVVMANANNRVDQEREAAHDLVASGVQGLVVYPVPRPDVMEAPDYLCSDTFEVPLVLVDTATPDQPHTQFVFDNEHLGYEATSWLLAHGHRRIGFVVGDEGVRHEPLRLRVAGYRRALADHGVPQDGELVRHFDFFSAEALRRVAGGIAAMPDRPTAVIATEDMCAAELIDHLAALGLRAPEDIQVVGFDDRPEVRRSRHLFNTTRPDFERLGERACEELVRCVEEPALGVRVYLLEVPLLIRRPLEAHSETEQSPGRLASTQVAP